MSDFESTKYDNFFTQPNRKAEEGVTINIPILVQNVFNITKEIENQVRVGKIRQEYENVEVKVYMDLV